MGEKSEEALMAQASSQWPPFSPPHLVCDERLSTHNSVPASCVFPSWPQGQCSSIQLVDSKASGATSGTSLFDDNSQCGHWL